jgi:cytochrome d ubiquinol oxidase subunit I
MDDFFRDFHAERIGMRSGEIKGLKEWPADQRPPVAVPFFAFRIMIGCACLMLGLVALGGRLRCRAAV